MFLAQTRIPTFREMQQSRASSPVIQKFKEIQSASDEGKAMQQATEARPVKTFRAAKMVQDVIGFLLTLSFYFSVVFVLDVLYGESWTERLILPKPEETVHLASIQRVLELFLASE
ncbi:MAG: hypothetical protein SGCHY_004139 [Lobulomycetales sp.]